MAVKKDKEQEVKDTLIIIDQESGMADIANIIEVNNERISAQGYSVPIGDTKAYTGRKGRIFIVNALPDAPSDYRRIAELEKSTVLKQITRYSDEVATLPTDGFKYVAMGILALIIVIMLFVK